MNEDVQYVPLSVLTNFARKVKAMRLAQKEYLDAMSRGFAPTRVKELLRAAKRHEAAVDRDYREAVGREKVALPYFSEAEKGGGS